MVGERVPIGEGEFYMRAVAVSFHTLCMLYPQHVGGSSEAAMVRKHPDLEAHASLFWLFDRNPLLTRLSRQLGNSAVGVSLVFSQVFTDQWRMNDRIEARVSLSISLAYRAIQITFVGCNNSASVSCFYFWGGGGGRLFVVVLNLH